MGILFLTTCHDDKFYKKADGCKEFYYQFCHKIYNNLSSGNCHQIERNMKMQKEAQMDKLEEDWNGLMQLGYCGFWKPVILTAFLKVILVDC